MGTKELAEKYLQKKNIKLLNGDFTAVLMPYLLMDCCYQLYTKKVFKLELSQMPKVYKSRWAESQKKFDYEFLSAFNKDEKEYIRDLCDNIFNESHNAIVRLKCGIMDLLHFEDFQYKDVHSHCLVCNTLAQMAQVFYNASNINRFGEHVDNNNIKGVVLNSYLLANEWHPVKEDISLSKDPKIESLVDSLIKVIVSFCVNEK